ncbi:arginine--tRNA ligase [Candidatus Parcubacteria bacterium]|nr:MAG: arginine--tRNA ligase [Candidatus Parcubacteria bacterium]
MDAAQSIRDALSRAFQTLGIPEEATLEHPGELENGDYATGAALRHAKQTGMKPRELAEKIVAEAGKIGGISKVEIAGAGFINFYLAPETFAAVLEEARSSDTWGANENEKGKKTIVEYTDPNPFKEFHIGHLVTNTIGESISRLFVYAGADVKRANYQGDVGRHVARAIWGLIQSGESPEDVKALGRAYAAGAKADIDGSVAKAEITAINREVYDRSDEKINDLYDRGRKTSLDHFEMLYAILGTKFDFYFFESEAGPFGKEVVLAHIKDGVFKESDGATVYEGEKKGLHTRVFLNSEGLPTYEAKELGLSKMKYEKFPYDQSFIVTGNEIIEYFKVLLAAMNDVFPDLAKKTTHVPHGMMRLEVGKMSSRTGNVITGESLIADLSEAARERAKESRAEDADRLAEQIAVAAVKYQILRQATGKDIIFNREQALSLEGDSGPYIQYAHARAQAIVEKAREQKVEANVNPAAEPSEVARLLARFPDIVERAAKNLEPQLVANYLVAFASAFNRWYANEHILDGTPAASHKVALADATRITLKKGLWLLGIEAPERM